MQPKSERKASSAKVEKAPWPPNKRRLRRLVEDAIVDAYGESEERTGLFTMIEEHLVLPFDTEVLGVTVSVVRIDLTVADEIVAICRRGTQRQPLPNPRFAAATAAARRRGMDRSIPSVGGGRVSSAVVKAPECL